MSRLDSMLRRLTAHRDVLNWATEALADVPGDIVEIGLGNGRTYDHLRETFPDRRIWVIERNPSPHPDCWPPKKLLLEGEAEDGFARLEALKAQGSAQIALLNYDLGSGDKAATLREADALASRLEGLLELRGLLVSVQPMPARPGWRETPMAETGGAGRVHVYRRLE